jgi:hypothetical protein
MFLAIFYCSDVQLDVISHPNKVRETLIVSHCPKIRKKHSFVNPPNRHTKAFTVPNDNFSPESGGNVNPNNAIEAISTHGTIKLKK